MNKLIFNNRIFSGFSTIAIILLLILSISACPIVQSESLLKKFEQVGRNYVLIDDEHDYLNEVFFFFETNSKKSYENTDILIGKTLFNVINILTDKINLFNDKYNSEGHGLSFTNSLSNKFKDFSLKDINLKSSKIEIKKTFYNVHFRNKLKNESCHSAIQSRGFIGGILGLLIGLFIWPVVFCSTVPMSLMLFAVTVFLDILAYITWAATLPEFAIILILLSLIPFNLGVISALVGIFLPFAFMFIGFG